MWDGRITMLLFSSANKQIASSPAPLAIISSLPCERNREMPKNSIRYSSTKISTKSLDATTTEWK